MDLKKFNKPIFYISFGLYFFLLVWVILLKASNFDRIIGCASFMLQTDLKERVIIGFKDIINASLYKDIETYLNIFITIPLGLYLPMLFQNKKAIKSLAVSTSIIITFELLQLFSGLGTFSLLDILTNLFGFVIGILIYYLSHLSNHEFAINVLNLSLLLIYLPLVLIACLKIGTNYIYYADFPWFNKFKVGPSLNHFDFPVN